MSRNKYLISILPRLSAGSGSCFSPIWVGGEQDKTIYFR